jgi:outer membrane protein
MKTKFIYIIAPLLGTILGSGPAWGLSLDEAVRAAIDNSHELKAMRLEQESARWAEVKARSGYMPRVDVSARHLFAEHFEELEIEFGGGVFTMPAIQPYTSFGVSASVEVFSGLKTVNQVEAARLAREISRQQLERASETTRVNIRTLFYRALGAQTLVEVADQNIQTLTSHLADVKARVRTGVSMRFDALRSEVQLEDARTEKVMAEDNVANARAR